MKAFKQREQEQNINHISWLQALGSALSLICALERTTFFRHVSWEFIKIKKYW